MREIDTDRVTNLLNTYNTMKYKTSKTYLENGNTMRMDVEIRLNDECRNGHEEFAMTCDIYRKARNGRWVYEGGGCAHDEIIKRFPKFKIFEQLHLCNTLGQPMHFIANTIYFLKRGEYNLTCLTEGEARELAMYVENNNAFQYKLEELGVLSRLENKAKEGIALLEELCGEKYTPEYEGQVKYGVYPLSGDNRADVEKKIAEGYFTDEKIEERKRAREEEEYQKVVEEIDKKLEAELKKINEDYNAQKLVLTWFRCKVDFIYYPHSKTYHFNRFNFSFEKQVTREEVDAFVEGNKELLEGYNVVMGKEDETVKIKDA